MSKFWVGVYSFLIGGIISGVIAGSNYYQAGYAVGSKEARLDQYVIDYMISSARGCTTFDRAIATDGNKDMRIIQTISCPTDIHQTGSVNVNGSTGSVSIGNQSNQMPCNLYTNNYVERKK